MALTAADRAAARVRVVGPADEVLAGWEDRIEAATRKALDQVMGLVADRVGRSLTAALVAHLPGKHDQRSHGRGGKPNRAIRNDADQKNHGRGGKTAGAPLAGDAALKAPPMDLARMGDDPRAAALQYRNGDNRDTSDLLPGYIAMNRQMRSGQLDAEMRARVADIDSVMAESQLPESITVYRGMSLHMAGREGSLVGSEFTDQAFSSTTTDPDHASSFGLASVAKITVPAGTSAIRMVDSDPDLVESEILLDRGLTYRITRERFVSSDFGDRHEVDMEVVPRG